MVYNRAKYEKHHVRINARARAIRKTPFGRIQRALWNSRASADHQGHEPCNATAEELVPTLVDECQLCGNAAELCLDHDHETGVFRGWLCQNCNRGLGMFKDDPSLLCLAIEYLDA